MKLVLLKGFGFGVIGCICFCISTTICKFSAFFKVNVNAELFVVKANIFNKPRRIYTECLGYGARYLAPWLARWTSPDSAGAVNGLNLYVYVGNNPLKYIDPTGHVKVIPADISLENYEIDVLNPIEETYQNNNLFYFPGRWFVALLG
jgi:RHS repeat-associated protein